MQPWFAGLRNDLQSLLLKADGHKDVGLNGKMVMAAGRGHIEVRTCQ